MYSLKELSKNTFRIGTFLLEILIFLGHDFKILKRHHDNVSYMKCVNIADIYLGICSGLRKACQKIT